MERGNDHKNVICGYITQAREQQNLDAVKPRALKFLMAFKLKKAENVFLLEKKKKEKVNKI